MKINLVSQIDPLKIDGGGEMITRELIESGIETGHRVRVSSAYPEQQYNQFSDADLFMLVDIFNQPSAKQRLDQGLIKSIIRSERYIHLDNAYVDCCDLPYLPCNGETDRQSCPYKSGFSFRRRRMLKRRGCFAANAMSLYGNAMLNVFLSPLHRRTVQRIVGTEAVGDYFELRPTVSTKLFYNEGRTRDIENLFVGAINEAKGLANLERDYPDGNIVIIGPNSLRQDDVFGYRVDKVTYEDIPAYMNRSKNFIFLPRWPEPLGRYVVDAALCGCKLVVNDNVGATSFDFDISDPANFIGGLDQFWNIIDDVVKDP